MDILPQHPKRRRLPFSPQVILVAALLAILGFGAVLLTGQASAATTSGWAALGESTATPSPAPTDVPVIDPSPSPTPTEEPAPPPPPPPPPSYPGLPNGSGDGRRVVYSNSMQRVWLVEADESVVGSWLVSGRKGMPKSGVYNVYSKSRWSRSGAVRMEYMTRFARGRRLSIGFHSIPFGRRGPIQSEAELGQYRSHGCVRQRVADALTLWNFAPIGTKVVVTP